MTPNILRTVSSSSVARIAYYRPLVTYFKRANSIKTINEIAERILGSTFLRLPAPRKLEELSRYAEREYNKLGIVIPDLRAAERTLQDQLKDDPSAKIKPSEIIIRGTKAHWSSHIVEAPFIRQSACSKYKDKDAALAIFLKCIYSGRFSLSNEINLLLMKGCDNNEIGTKLQLFLEFALKKQTHLIATDISLNALSITRGLDALKNEKSEAFGRAIRKSDIVLRDEFNIQDAQDFDQEGQRIALPLRIGAILPYKDMKNVTSSLIQSNHLIFINFLSASEENINTLRDGFYNNLCVGKIAGTELKYLDAHPSNGSNSLCFWKKKNLRLFLKTLGAHIMGMRSIKAKNDKGQEVTFLVCLLKGLQN